MKDIYLYHKDIDYPKNDNFFSPNEMYPEYPWVGDVADIDNQVYNAVRECFLGLELDIKNFGKSNWNPLGEIIKNGDTVLLKPNWVSHKNNNHNFGLECLITHPSVLRPVIDYTIKALGDKGKILIGDAPIQGADIKELFKKSHLEELFDFYKKKGIYIEIYDFRLYESLGRHGVYNKKCIINQNEMAVEIDLGNLSSFNTIDNQNRVYQVMDYPSLKTMKFHENSKHVYSINRKVLEADVIINLPKPKTHKLAGVTGAQKNMVGIVAEKACLPHVSLGAKNKNGDSYPKRNILKRISVILREKKSQMESKGYYYIPLIIRYIDFLIRLLFKMFSNNKYELGSWYGNDTIWRTIFDLNYIVKYADKNGVICDKPQRKFFHLADMIISGEGNGPLSPSAKKTGYLLAGTNSIYVDWLITKLMGFDESKIPSVYKALRTSEYEMKNIIVSSNDKKFNNKRINSITIPNDMRFLPPTGWKDFF